MSFQGPRGVMTQGPASQLPYPFPFSEAERLTIEDAIRIGVTRVIASQALDCRTADEKDFTEALVSELNRMMNVEDVPGFSASWLETVPRGGELRSFDGRHVEKRPDMVFRRQGVLKNVAHREYCGLFVECKIVDASHTMYDYCFKGVSRFVKGEYAWAVNLAMMLGYSRDSYSLPDHLNRHIEKLGHRYETRGLCSPEEPYVTIHDRTWQHVSGELPGEITLRHLWVQVF